MTFVLNPLWHYNSITKPHARFLLSFLEYLTIDFPSHFILSLIDVYRDMATRNKLIFSLDITRILHHFSVSFLTSDHFSVMCVIDVVTVRWSEAQLRPKWPRIETATPLASSTSSTSAHSSSVGGVTLDTLSDELCQVNSHVGSIARWQARLGGFIESPTPSLETSKDEDDDGGDDEDDGANSSSDDEMIAWVTCPLSFVTKRGSSFRYESSHIFRRRVST